MVCSKSPSHTGRCSACGARRQQGPVGGIEQSQSQTARAKRLRGVTQRGKKKAMSRVTLGWLPSPVCAAGTVPTAPAALGPLMWAESPRRAGCCSTHGAGEHHGHISKHHGRPRGAALAPILWLPLDGAGEGSGGVHLGARSVATSRSVGRATAESVPTRDLPGPGQRWGLLRAWCWSSQD